MDGKLERAVNIIECKRINNAIEYNWGDTEGILHHATVPLKAGGEKFGLLNVASPVKHIFRRRISIASISCFPNWNGFKTSKVI